MARVKPAPDRSVEVPRVAFRDAEHRLQVLMELQRPPIVRIRRRRAPLEPPA